MPDREMSKSYWEAMAPGYEDEIFSVAHQDRRGLVRRWIKRVGSHRRSVLDAGCGIGYFLPLLSAHFGRVYANDLSVDLLDRARASHGAKPHIVFLSGDISKVCHKIPPVDVVLSVNALIASSARIREKILAAMISRLKRGGHLLLVVPSMESLLYVDQRFVQWKQKNGMSAASALRAVYLYDSEADHKARQGVIGIDGVATKHYLKEEMEALLNARGMRMVECVKVEYNWNSEFAHPPAWMKAPYPWDWLFVARRPR